MTTDFRALCAELLRGLDESQHPEFRYPGHLLLVMATARAALAQPEPDGLTPQPADGEVAELAAWLRGANWDRQRQTLATRAAELLERLSTTQKELERERLSTTQKELERERLRLAACGAVAMADTPETAAKARDCLPEYWSASADDIARQIDKLMRLSPPQPVPVAERLPGPEDCDAEGRCWMHGKIEGDWRLISVANPGVPKLSYCFSHWLPAHALPLPS